jgi:L-ascorbate metabolism protein UlaG (beta-lactamase superfamily)
MYQKLRKNTKPFNLFLCLGLGAILMLGRQEPISAQDRLEFEPSRQRLEQVRQWLGENPPDGKNRTERRERMAVIQSACDQLAPSDYIDYIKCWNTDDSAATAAEERHPALYYLRKATSQALADIHTTKVKQGLAVWHLYNMGYVFKTPDACFGIDIHLRGSEQLTDVLDFLLITHEHQDHWSAPLIDTMVAAHKPVITRWRTGTTIINKPCEFRFGSCRVKVDIGDHHQEQPDKHNDMLMFQVDCGEKANNSIIYHSGDGSNFLKMCPDKKIDIFIVHVQVGMSVEAAIEHLKPRLTFVSHVMELGHSPTPPNAWRWSFEYAYDRVRIISEDKAVVLTWGEGWLMPGTILEKVSGK